MFTPIPPDSKSSTKSDENLTGTSDQLKLPISSHFFIFAVLCQVAAGLATFLPWTKSTWHHYLGYEAIDHFDMIYSGLAGKINLGGAVGVLVLVAVDYKIIRNPPLVVLFALLAWNLFIASWLAYLVKELEGWRDYGLLVAATMAIGSVGCMIGVMIKRNQAV